MIELDKRGWKLQIMTFVIDLKNKKENDKV